MRQNIAKLRFKGFFVAEIPRGPVGEVIKQALLLFFSLLSFFSDVSGRDVNVIGFPAGRVPDLGIGLESKNKYCQKCETK